MNLNLYQVTISIIDNFGRDRIIADNYKGFNEEDVLHIVKCKYFNIGWKNLVIKKTVFLLSINRKSSKLKYEQLTLF